MSDEEVHISSEDKPIITRYEPGFRRVFARGSLVQVAEDDPDTIQLAFWSSKDPEVQIDEETTAVGYRLESEAMLTWRAARRLHKLLGMYIEEHAPEEPDAEAEGDAASPGS